MSSFWYLCWLEHKRSFGVIEIADCVEHHPKDIRTALTHYRMQINMTTKQKGRHANSVQILFHSQIDDAPPLSPDTTSVPWSSFPVKAVPCTLTLL